MKIRDALGNKYNLSLKEIENTIKKYKHEYPYKQFEIDIIEENREYITLTLWLDDCDWEVHIMDIYPTKEEFIKIDKEGLCGERLSHPLYCEKHKSIRCDSCRKCLTNFIGDK